VKITKGFTTTFVLQACVWNWLQSKGASHCGKI